MMIRPNSFAFDINSFKATWDERIVDIRTQRGTIKGISVLRTVQTEI